MNGRPGALFYFDILPALEKMDVSDVGRLFISALRYAQYGEIPELSGSADIVWSFMQSSVDRDNKQYWKKQLQSRWKVACREAQKNGQESPSFEDWLSVNNLSVDNICYQQLSCDNSDGFCYPTTTQLEPSSNSSSNFSANISSSSFIEGIEWIEGIEGDASNSQNAAFPQPYQQADEADWNRMKNEAMRKLTERGIRK